VFNRVYVPSLSSVRLALLATEIRLYTPSGCYLLLLLVA